MDSDLGYACTMFELDGGHIVECLMQAWPVIEDLDVVEDCGSGLLSGVEVVEVNEFILQRTEEALGAGVVVAIALGGHARTNPMNLHQLRIRTDHVVPAPVGMVDQAKFRSSAAKRHRECIQDELRIEQMAHRPAHHAPAEQVEHRNGGCQACIIA